MLIRSADSSPFATGAAHYNATPKTVKSSQIILQVRIGGWLTTAFVHTDSKYVICHPDVAEEIGLLPEKALFDDEIRISGQLVEGRVHKLEIEFIAEEGKGESLRMLARAFVVDRSVSLYTDELPLSSIGFGGCLESMCFAIEGNRRLFYFG